MINIVYDEKVSLLGPIHRAVLNLDIDPAAERYVVLDRRTMVSLSHGINPPTNHIRVILPKIYSTAPYSLVGIVDDNAQYNAKFLDGVTLESVDLASLV